MMDAVWEIPEPWSWVLLFGCLVILALVVFWIQFVGLSRRSGRAAEIAAIKTAAWMILYGGSFTLIFWIVSRFMTPGFARYLVGGGIWWLLSQKVLSIVWSGLDRGLGNR